MEFLGYVVTRYATAIGLGFVAAEGLEVDIGRVHVTGELPPRLLAHLAGRRRHRPHAAGPAGLGPVDRVLSMDDRNPKDGPTISARANRVRRPVPTGALDGRTG